MSCSLLLSISRVGCSRGLCFGQAMAPAADVAQQCQRAACVDRPHRTLNRDMNEVQRPPRYSTSPYDTWCRATTPPEASNPMRPAPSHNKGAFDLLRSEEMDRGARRSTA
ncbi:hypothetical protein BC567DRAFT_228456 [Phyllosticta citribraziliensis]